MNLNQLFNKRHGAATNSIVLAFVQCLTMATGLAQTMILSRQLTKTQYGTYSEGLLVVNFLVPFLLLGLSNAITYYSGQQNAERNKYINSIFSLLTITGLIGFIGIIIFRHLIAMYFGNLLLEPILIIISILPLLQNLITGFQTLYVAENMAFNVAFRNAVISILQITIVILGVFVFEDIKAIFLLLIVMDVLQLYIFWFYFKRKKYTVKLTSLDTHIVKNILAYAIPLALSATISTISIYLDKLLIGKLTTVEDFALYSNMAKELPFSFIVSSFTTVIMPYFVKMHSKGNDKDLTIAWKSYLELGYSITWIIVGTAIANSKSILLFLYSDKYIQGLSIFEVYLFIELLRFSYFGIVLSTFGKTKMILWSSLFSVFTNFILNIVLFHFMGMIGPAVATLISIVIMQLMQLHYSKGLLKCKWTDIFDFKYTSVLILEVSVIGFLTKLLGSFLSFNYLMSFIVCASIMIGVLIMINHKRILNLMKYINSMR